MADAVLLVDEAGHIIFANAQAESLFLARGGALLGQPVEMLIPEESHAVHRQHRLRYSAAPAPRRMGTTMILHARRLDGTEVPVDVSLSAVTDGGGHQILACIRDVTWREHLLGELRESEQRYRMVVEGASEVFYQVSLKDDPFRGQVQFVSPQCQRLTDCAPDDFITHPNRWIELVHPEDVPALAETTRVLLASRSEGTRYYRIRNGQGEYRHVADRIVPLLDSQGAVIAYQGVARDITERVRAQEERQRLDDRLRQAERMEALGCLAGGVAHDFNNLLTVILGFCETVQRDLDPSSSVRQDVEEIAKAGRRAANLTRQLLAFSRTQVIAPRVVDLNAHLMALEEMLLRTVTEQIDIVFSFAEDLWPAFLDPSQVDQIVINLVANARDAIPGRGLVTITAANASLDEVFGAMNAGFIPGDYVVLAVSDSGTGMDEVTLRNAFVPFFTTKPEGRGTGIGLASVYGIVKQNGGFIKVKSEVERGTSVEVYLPRYQGEDRSASMESSTASAPARGHETVLLVEDNDQVRHVTRKLLTQLGYSVLEATTPSAAITLCTMYDQSIHVLLTDVVMPEMNGVELSERIRILRPRIATVFMSGYAPHFAANINGPDNPVHYLPKPFEQASLATAIRQALAGAANGLGDDIGRA
jgi:hypothetical protein